MLNLVKLKLQNDNIIVCRHFTELSIIFMKPFLNTPDTNFLSIPSLFADFLEFAAPNFAYFLWLFINLLLSNSHRRQISPHNNFAAYCAAFKSEYHLCEIIES